MITNYKIAGYQYPATPDIRYPAFGLAGYPAKSVSGASLLSSSLGKRCFLSLPLLALLLALSFADLFHFIFTFTRIFTFTTYSGYMNLGTDKSVFLRYLPAGYPV